MERGDLPVLQQQVVKGQRDVAVDDGPVVSADRVDDDLAVQAHLLCVVLADVWVVPVQAGVREPQFAAVLAAGGDGLLSFVGDTVGSVVQAQAVPVNGLVQAGLVADLDYDGRSLLDPQHRSWDGTVVGQHAQRCAGDGLTDRPDVQRQDVAVGQRNDSGRTSLRKAADIPGEQVVCNGGVVGRVCHGYSWGVLRRVAPRAVAQ